MRKVTSDEGTKRGMGGARERGEGGSKRRRDGARKRTHNAVIDLGTLV